MLLLLGELVVASTASLLFFCSYFACFAFKRATPLQLLRSKIRKKVANVDVVPVASFRLSFLTCHPKANPSWMLDVSRSQKVVACCLLPKAELTQRSNKSRSSYIAILSSYKFTGINWTEPTSATYNIYRRKAFQTKLHFDLESEDALLEDSLFQTKNIL